jgi:uncharacterized protein (DUF927 family)
MQGGGFHFRGSTSTGKTTSVFVGGSVCGGDSEHGFLQTWKATANGLEIIAADHNHSLLCLDEIGECDSREIGNVAYMLANGRGKARMTKTIQARHSQIIEIHAFRFDDAANPRIEIDLKELRATQAEIKT